MKTAKRDPRQLSKMQQIHVIRSLRASINEYDRLIVIAQHSKTSRLQIVVEDQRHCLEALQVLDPDGADSWIGSRERRMKARCEKILNRTFLE